MYWINFNGSGDIKAGLLKGQGKAASASEKVNANWAFASVVRVVHGVLSM